MKKTKKSEEPYPSKEKAQKKSKKFCLKAFFIKIFRKIKKVKIEEDLLETINHLEVKGKNLTQDEKFILNNFLKFGNKTVEDAMVQRSDIVAIKYDSSHNDLKKMLLHCPHTRTLIYQKNLDNIIGFVHLKDLLTILDKEANFQLHKIIRKPIISASSTKLITLLAEMRKKRTHISLVIDEYGGTDGIVTIEDIIEEIFGEINDEHDNNSEEHLYQIIDSKTIICNSRLEVEDLEKILDMKLKNEDDEFDTIGGLVLDKIGHVPPINTKLKISDDLELEVIDSSPRLIKKVKIKLKNEKRLLQNLKA